MNIITVVSVPLSIAWSLGLIALALRNAGSRLDRVAPCKLSARVQMSCTTPGQRAGTASGSSDLIRGGR